MVKVWPGTVREPLDTNPGQKERDAGNEVNRASQQINDVEASRHA